jgi:hypothetical protein
MSKTYEKSKFIEYLRETPLVSFACKKVGLSRATYYRWVNGDKEFRDQVQKVLRQGRDNINDLAEATLIKMIKSENFNATRFWLQNNNKRYVPIRTTYVEPQHDHQELKPGERCTYCGTSKPKHHYSSDTEPTSFYEREIWLSQKTFEAEAKKKRKMTGKDRKELMKNISSRKKGAEIYEQMAKSFPSQREEYLQMAEEVRNGTRPIPYIQGKAGKQPKKLEGEINEETTDRY